MKNEEDMSIYMRSLGVIVDKKGNYLYCVVAEAGLMSKGMGEMSIYAAWKMKKLDTSFDVNKAIQLDTDYIIADDNRETKSEKYKFILFAKSAPAPKKTLSGWENKQKKLYNQIIKVGRRCYRGTGKCLN